MIDRLKNYVVDTNYRIIIFDDKINIINYKEIITLNNKMISFTVNTKIINIHGNNLQLKKMIDDEILIYGTIDNIEVNDYE